MPRRSLLVLLLVVSAIAFVLGVSIERSSADTHAEPAPAAESGEVGEGSAEHAEEAGADEGHAAGALAVRMRRFVSATGDGALA